MPNSKKLSRALLSLFQLSILTTPVVAATTDAGVPSDAAEIKPLLVGSQIPSVSVKTADGKSIRLESHLKDKKTVLIFYRGGWCPYCNRQLSGLKDIEADLKKLGFQIVAVSSDLPEKLSDTSQKDKLSYELLSDSDAIASRAFGIAFKVTETNRLMMKTVGIDIEKASGNAAHILPVPSVFVVNKAGTIVFSYVNPNYKIRLSSEVVLSAAKTMAE